MIAAGGTGGHVYPALAIAEALKQQQPQAALSFVGVVGGFERPLVAASGLPFASYDEVRAGPLNGVGRRRQLRSLIELAWGTVQAWLLLARRRPQAVLLTGGWCGLPVSLAGWLRRVPMLIYLPDIEPALTIRALRPFARRVALTVDESRVFFPHNDVIVTGYPVRRALRTATRADAVAHFGLDPRRQTLLALGGSRGARTINQALLAAAPALLERGVQLIHVTGQLDWPEIEAQRAALPDGTHYHVFPYLHEDMGLALAAADLVISRAGASVLGEYPLFGLPAVLIPYPHWRYQQVNAEYLAARGAALVLADTAVAAELRSTVLALLDDPARLAQMRAAAGALAQPNGALNAARALTGLIEGAA
jgi:UDP-N-acetylglucosamine--N-acetylmuramyl-(pentapeptide) pyrophosphoryl-undecaprenol N-acetylglucosamine transferase